MNISYSKGGDYSNDVIQSFAEAYIADRLYKNLFNKFCGKGFLDDGFGVLT